MIALEKSRVSGLADARISSISTQAQKESYLRPQMVVFQKKAIYVLKFQIQRKR